jgi:two-component system OmpR family response regulator
MRVLIVEDETNLGQALEQGLSAEGFETTWVTDGQRGLDEGVSGSFDAIVLDILLPKMNGFKVCGELRARGVTTPILMLTAKDGELDEAEALDTGADDFLRKPFNYVVLVARLNALLRRGTLQRNLIAQGFVVDVVGHRVQRDGISVELTSRETALAQRLLESIGEVVTKTDLIASVWGEDFEGDPNIVEVYIGYLRKKLDLPFNKHSIQTVRGVGYRLELDDD